MKRTTDGAQRRGATGKTGGLRGRFGFTLVELLTVIAIIGMLGAISITTVRASIQSAKETQTRTTIAKIDNVLTACYEKYQYRRVDLKDAGIDANSRLSRIPAARARARILIMRDLLRCDFPCTPWELIRDPLYKASETPLQEAIASAAGGNLSRSYFEEEGYPGTFDFTNDGGYPHVANAELLYLVVMNADPEARATFSEREVSDVDGNGLKEFVDGWGKPICWMRWAPGLENSDRQPVEEGGDSPVNPLNDPNFDINNDADPFDPMNVGVHPTAPDTLLFPDDVTPEYGWFLVPYVFSAGPDGKYGLTMPSVIDNACRMNDPFSGASLDNGVPYARTYKDNIDNHTLVR